VQQLSVPRLLPSRRTVAFKMSDQLRAMFPDADQASLEAVLAMHNNDVGAACSTVPAFAHPTIRLIGAPCGMLRVGPDRDTGSRVAVPVQRIRLIRPVWKVRAICERL